jgi:hypothetical protein
LQRKRKRKLSFFSAEGVKVYFSFSTNINGCVATMIDYLKNNWFVLDIDKPLFTNSDQELLFRCDGRGGAYNVLLDKVRGLNGNIHNVPNNDWVDNGEGGAFLI